MVQQVRLMMFLVNMVDYSMSFLSLSTLFFFFDRQVGGNILSKFYFMLKSYSWGGGVVVAHEILVSAQGPLVLVLRLRVWG